ncbi:MAG: hypothetical protein AABZ74_15965 [Cyanobacteriota bacterium]
MSKKISLILFVICTLSFSLACRRIDDEQPKPEPSKKIDNTEEDPLPSEPSDTPSEPQSSNYIELNILTQNCWGVPKIAGVYNVTKDQDERFSNIGDVVNGFDIVNLQETFGENTKIILDKAKYITKTKTDNGSFLSYGAGLTSFSKFPLVKKDFIKFSQCSGADCFSNKGVLFMRLKVPVIGEIDIYNTHYQAIESKEDLRVDGNREFGMLLKRNDVGNPTIITGDFNYTNYDATDSTSKAFDDFKKKFNPIDTFRVKNRQDTGFTSDPSLNEYVDKKDKPQRLDYVFLLPESRGIAGQKISYKFEVLESKIVNSQPVNGKFLSDHFGINTKIRINLN